MNDKRPPKSGKQQSPRMDELLAKLRRSMAELSIQGDDFTRQMWQMYAIFEEVVANRTDGRASHSAQLRLRQGEATARDDYHLTSHQHKAEEGGGEGEARKRQDTTTRQSPRRYSPGARKKRMSAGQYHHYQLRCHHRTRSEPSSNPLLDTISVLTSDPCDSDDYYDLAAAYQQRKRLPGGEEIKTRSSPSCQQHPSDADRDSIGYAGSNSIDSGYKSLCPTPEIPDSYYGAEGGRGSSCTAGATDSSSSNSSPSRSRDKPKIMMGTRVMGRQCPGPRGPPPPPGPSRRGGDPALHDVNLDHLMYLRQSLISAIQRCESSSSSQSRDGSPTVGRAPPPRRGSTGSPKRTQSPHVERRRAHTHSAGVPLSPRRTSPSHHRPPPGSSSSSSSASSPSYQKSVRFDTDIKVAAAAAVKAKQSAQISSGGSPRSVRKQSRSILGDPLCAGLRSQLESGDRLTPDCTMEEEIDALLYGRAEYYDLESVEDFPCSYVTMIEEKYRCGRANVAKVKMLKDKPIANVAEDKPDVQIDANPDTTLVVTAAEATSRSITKVVESSAGRARSQSEPQIDLKPSAKSRFTEVAKCMLEIIEDLQLQVDSPEEGGMGAAVGNQPIASGTEVDTASAISVTYHTTAADYHVYEEILYDFVAGAAASGRSSRSQDIPPPLPARPSAMSQKQERTIFAQTVVSTTVSTEEVSDFRRPARNCPKQRSNLYSLVRDQAERRDISRSLEQEWRSVQEPGDLEDEYGFKKSYQPS